jgi:hypothetical protein
VAYPDVIALLRTYLLPVVTPRPVVSRVPDPRPAEWVQIRRIGGPQVRPVRDRPNVDVFAWAQTDPAAWELAELLRRSIHALAGTTLLGPMVYRVDETLGPRSLDDELTGSPRVWATYSLDVRADDAIQH